MPDGGFGLKPHRLVRLAEMFTALGMAELDEVEAAVLQHHRRDFSGPGAVVGPMHGLGANLDGRLLQHRLHLADGCEGRNDEALNA